MKKNYLFTFFAVGIFMSFLANNSLYAQSTPPPPPRLPKGSGNSSSPNTEPGENKDKDKNQDEDQDLVDPTKGFRILLPINSPFAVTPNPFSHTIQLQFEVSTSTNASIYLYNALGRLTAIVTKETFSKGQHTIRYDSSYLPKGYYFIRYQDDTGQTKTIKTIKF